MRRSLRFRSLNAARSPRSSSLEGFSPITKTRTSREVPGTVELDTPRFAGRIVVYVLLTILVWGLFSLDQGFFQDEVIFLSQMQGRDMTRLDQLFAPIVAPTRRIGGPVYGLALLTGQPRIALQILYGIVWLGIGLMADRVVRLLFPEYPLASLFAGALTLSATSDLLSNSLVSLTYNLSILFYLGALFCLLRWLLDAQIAWLFGSALLLSCSLWTTDGVLTSVCLTPLLLWAAGEMRFGRRLLLAAIVWLGSLSLYLLSLIPFLLDPTSYASRAFVSMSWAARVGRAVDLFIFNFTPWSWVSGRPVWWNVRPPIVIPFWLCLILTAFGTLVVLWISISAMRKARCFTRSVNEVGSRRWVGVSAVLLLMALASNALFAGIQASEWFYRTHLNSRVWASLLVAVVAGKLCQEGWRRAGLGLIPMAVFVFFGIWSGLERQDFYLSHWRGHRQELASILSGVPALRPDARVILHVPEPDAYKATEAAYLARCWAVLMYQDLTMAKRLFLWSAERGAGCVANEEGFACWEEGQRACFEAGECPGWSAAYDELVVLSYRKSEGRYRLTEKLGADLLGGDADRGSAYVPSEQILRKPIDPFVQSLLSEEKFLARFLPGSH